MCDGIIISFCRVIKQIITPEVCSLGGVSLKHPLPFKAQALSEFLAKHNLVLPSGPLTILYRIQLGRVVYFSQHLSAGEERKSFTVCYPSDNDDRLIQYFQNLQQKIIAVMNILTPSYHNLQRLL